MVEHYAEDYSLVMGIVDGLQPDPVYFQTTFRYIP